MTGISGMSDMDGEPENEMDGDNINVVVRVRPRSVREANKKDEVILKFPGEGQLWVSFSWF